MSEHITQWLSPYLDGELRGTRLHEVEKHLADCPACQAELKALEDLSALLRDVPAPQFTSPEQLSARVNLRLPRGLPRDTKRKVQEVGWWMIPVGLLVIWIFINTSALVSDLVSSASEFGLLKDAPAWVISGSSTGAYWSERMAEFGLLNGSSLKWLEETEAFMRNSLPQITWQISIALLYLGWIAIWWARHTRREHGQVLKG